MDLLNPVTKLPEDPAVARLAAGDPPAEVAARYPASCAAWATLAETALRRSAPGDGSAGEPALVVEAYAYARTGYHRGLDALRRAGWKGSGPIPWSHAPNRGFLRSLRALAAAAAAIGEHDEAQRCEKFYLDSAPDAEAMQ